MKYALLSNQLHDTADMAKKYFADNYGATHFKCEEEVDADLPLKPTWQATTPAGYHLCVEVSDTPFSPSLHAFVTGCAVRGVPVRLWVVVPEGATPGATRELKQAKELGIGVLELSAQRKYVHHRPVPLSLFGLRKTEFRRVPKKHREALKEAEDAFLDGSPEKGCQEVCQTLEALTRRFAQHSYQKGWWAPPVAVLKARSFTTAPWAKVLERLDGAIDEKKVRKVGPSFRKALVAGARHYTDWRNILSHRPKSIAQRKARDEKLRTMFEATRDLLLEWFKVATRLRLTF